MVVFFEESGKELYGEGPLEEFKNKIEGGRLRTCRTICDIDDTRIVNACWGNALLAYL